MTIPTFSLPAFPSHFLSQQSVKSPIGWIAPPLAEGAHSNRSGLLSCTFDSSDVLQDPGNALLDRFGSLYRCFLSEVPKFLVLRGCDVEVLMRLRG